MWVNAQRDHWAHQPQDPIEKQVLSGALNGRIFTVVTPWDIFSPLLKPRDTFSHYLKTSFSYRMHWMAKCSQCSVSSKSESSKSNCKRILILSVLIICMYQLRVNKSHTNLESTCRSCWPFGCRRTSRRWTYEGWGCWAGETSTCLCVCGLCVCEARMCVGL